MMTTKLSQKCSTLTNRSFLINVLIIAISFVSIAFAARAFIYGILFLDCRSMRNNRYHGRFTRIIFLLNESTEIMKLVLKYLCILYFNLAIENWSVYNINLLDTKKKVYVK